MLSSTVRGHAARHVIGGFRGLAVSVPRCASAVADPDKKGDVKAARGHHFPEFIEAWNKEVFYGLGSFMTVGGGALAALEYISPLWIGPLLGYWALGIHDLRTASNIRRNFPVLGNFRYIFETIRPEIQQYFIESEHDGKPFNREQRASVYRRAKNAGDTLPFGTKLNTYADGYEFLPHAMFPADVPAQNLRVDVGVGRCTQPYSSSIFNISGMSYGALSPHAVRALNMGAAAGNFSHNTGEGSVTPHHLGPGGDVIWNLGTGYFGCRTLQGTFCPIKFAEVTAKPSLKMIEIKLSQGAKPAHGGLLPKDKVTAEIAEIRGIEMGKDVHSPPRHSMFSNFTELMSFIKQLRELSGGKPVGVKLCVGNVVDLATLIRAAAEGDPMGRPDFITVDGGEGGTGAAPKGFSNYIGYPGRDGLALVIDLLDGAGLRADVESPIRVFNSGRIIGSTDMARAIAIGADAVNSARGMMFTLGCIQALKCNTDKCPTGVATQDPDLYKGLVVEDKWRRVFFYHKNMVRDLSHLVAAAGKNHPYDLKRSMLMRRVDQRTLVSYEEIYPSVPKGALLEGTAVPKLQKLWDEAGKRLQQGAEC